MVRAFSFQNEAGGKNCFADLWLDGNLKAPIRTTTQIRFESLRNLQTNERNVCWHALVVQLCKRNEVKVVVLASVRRIRCKTREMAQLFWVKEWQICSHRDDR